MATAASIVSEAEDTKDVACEKQIESLKHAIDHAAHLLPTQGPIGVFVHHNTLHAFEDLPFEEGILAGSAVLGCQPFLTEERYHEELRHGRITQQDLEAVVREELREAAGENIVGLGTRQQLRMAMLLHPIRRGSTAELKWFIAETDALRKIRSDGNEEAAQRLIEGTRRWVETGLQEEGTQAPGVPQSEEDHRYDRNASQIVAEYSQRHGLETPDRWSPDEWEAFALHVLWEQCRRGIRSAHLENPPRPSGVRHRDLLLEATGEDSDVRVNALLTRFCAAFLDQGLANLQVPHRDEGFYCCFMRLYGQPSGPPDRWLTGLQAELQRLEAAGINPIESILESLQLLGIAESDWDSYLTATFLALRGWAGMVREIEMRSDEVVRPIPSGSLTEYLAVRLILVRLAIARLARETLGYTGPLSGLRAAAQSHLHRRPAVSNEQRAFTVFQVCQVLGRSVEDLVDLSAQDWSKLWDEIEQFGGLYRRRALQMAYERRYRIQTLDAIGTRAGRPPVGPPEPTFQAVFCIDDREESFRRHLEEVSADVETYASAGFFGVAMYHRGVGEAHFSALCPVVIKPKHWIEEDVVAPHENAHQRRTQVRKTFGTASHRFYIHSRTFFGGAFLTATLGVLATVPLVARVLFPRLTGWIRRMSGRAFKPAAQTVLELEAWQGPEAVSDGRKYGFTVDEMTAIVERVLRETGLTSRFAPMVFFFGHGSTSLNNPHESAYNCGACGGSRGGPNARAYAHMANDPRVRARLAERGITIPITTVFVGGFHNTCDDSLTFFDLQRLPRARKENFDQAHEIFRKARERNAHERCRLFHSAPLTLTPEEALQHVEGRSEDLAQARPEYNHSTNAICLVGRRPRYRNLFMNRRAFLVSYDPTQDDVENTILTRILLPVFPVCGGISLEYFFSTVDSAGYGCGSKLPHNIASLVGVMDGHASDLRTGLSWQMCELHEPLRLLIVVETTPDIMLRIIDRNPGIGQMARNGWVQVAVIDPNSNAIQCYRNGRFEPHIPEVLDLPRVKSSRDWYGGRREHLGFALVDADSSDLDARHNP